VVVSTGLTVYQTYKTTKALTKYVHLYGLIYEHITKPEMRYLVLRFSFTQYWCIGTRCQCALWIGFAVNELWKVVKIIEKQLIWITSNLQFFFGSLIYQLNLGFFATDSKVIFVLPTSISGAFSYRISQAYLLLWVRKYLAHTQKNIRPELRNEPVSLVQLCIEFPAHCCCCCCCCSCGCTHDPMT